MKTFLLLVLVVFSFQLVDGQQINPPTPIPQQTPTTVTEDRRNNNQNIPPVTVTRAGTTRIVLNRNIINLSPLYRKPTNNELNEIKPDNQYFEQYKNFLKQKNTGLLRLVPDLGCSENTSVVIVSDECLKHSFPGNGSAFSFRVQSYRLWRLSDIALDNGNLISLSKYQQGIMVNLGDVPIEKVDDNYKDAEFIKHYMPLLIPSEAQKDFIKFKSGVSVGSKKYASVLKSEVNSTYILRSIAFRCKYFRAIGGTTYDEFDFDSRKDILVVFRIISKNDDGSIVLLWKELRNEKAPKLNF
jgi:hypothetical protein